MRLFRTFVLKRLYNNFFYRQISFYCQTSVKNIIDERPVDKIIKVKGWVKSVRHHKDRFFLDFNDGSSFQHLQVVASAAHCSSDISFGCCVEIDGLLRKSLYPNQLLELEASKITVLGTCDNKDYPIKMGQKHSMDYLRNFPHLKFNTKTFSSLLRVRNAASMAAHSFFQEKNFCLINTPILTTNDCEGAGEVFRAESLKNVGNNGTVKNQTSGHFFATPTHLTVSGQLHLEALTGPFSRVYTFGPTFRAEDSHTRHHLSEFYMLEAEVAFTRSLCDIIKCIEDLIKCMTSAVLERCSSDVQFFFKNSKSAKLEERVDKVLHSSYNRITYTEAINLLLNSSKEFSNKIFWGSDLHKEHERFLVEYFNDVPVFVTDYPAAIKPFYARDNGDNATVASLDLLFSDVGEVCGGSLREERYAFLKSKLEQLNLCNSLDWYLDLRKFGSCPHGGFGLGFERYIQMVLGLNNIKDAIPFPRYTSSCKL